MDVLLTPDVLSLLEITSCSVQSTDVLNSCSLLAFSTNHIRFVSVETPPTFNTSVYVYIRTRKNLFKIPVFIENHIQTTSKNWILSFTYNPEELASPLKEKWLSLLAINHFQQLRKDIRLPMTKKIMTELSLQDTQTQIWIHDTQKNCILNNISFSGARLFSTDDLQIDSDDKLILKICFSNPSEISTIRAFVLRKKTIHIGDTTCIDIAIRFFDPVDLVLLSRLTNYFNNNSNIV